MFANPIEGLIFHTLSVVSLGFKSINYLMNVSCSMLCYEHICAGELSQRMQIPGNMWLEVWQNAKPVPARRQRRLFDDTKEAEKVLCIFIYERISHFSCQ